MLLPAAFLIWAPSAYAWSWPVQGSVLQPFSYDPAHPEAAGQHRGIDIGAAAPGETVVAPAAGTVSFAGTVAANGRSVTIQTADGYSVTLTHLGSTLVAKGAPVAEQDAVGTVGPSGTPEVEGPYVHLGIRVTAEPDGYLDPLDFLPSVATGGGGDGSTSSQPGAGSGSSTATSGMPPTRANSSGSSTHKPAPSDTGRGEASHAGKPDARADVRPQRSSHRPAVSHEDAEPAHTIRPATTRRHVDVPAGSSRRPVVETAVPAEPLGLGAGHEIRPSASTPAHETARRQAPTSPLPPVLNGVAALAALAAAFVVARGRRRRRAQAGPMAAAEILHLPRSSAERPVARAA